MRINKKKAEAIFCGLRFSFHEIHPLSSSTNIVNPAAITKETPPINIALMASLSKKLAMMNLKSQKLKFVGLR
ncbi:MAG: hypothetical protein R2825_21180 [Saprospiraceae bacterium]